MWSDTPPSNEPGVRAKEGVQLSGGHVHDDVAKREEMVGWDVRVAEVGEVVVRLMYQQRDENFESAPAAPPIEVGGIHDSITALHLDHDVYGSLRDLIYRWLRISGL